jgi:RNA polymerase sigma factor (TIGR02999 family)
MNSASNEFAPDLMRVIYVELRRLVADRIAADGEYALQPSTLLQDAWLSIGGDRPHFFALGTEVMRHFLVDLARRRLANPNNYGQKRIEDLQMLAVDEALSKFTMIEPEKAELAKLRYFAELTLEEAAEMRGIPLPTAQRWWKYARAWLHQEIKVGTPPP